MLGRAYGAEPLTVRVDTTDLRLRRDAPIPLEVQLDNHTPTLRTGRLEAAILHRDRRIGVHRSVEITLTQGPRPVSMLLPPVTGVEAGDGLAVRLRFVGEGAPVELGDHRLGAVSLGGRELVVAIARTDRRMTKLEALRERALRLETLRPKRAESMYLPFSTVESSMLASRLPTQPIAWCAYDLAVIDGPVLAGMNEKQMTALARWIEGGGSAAIFAEAPLVERHLEFLRRLAADDGVKLELDQQSRLKTPDGKPVRLAPGIGRAVLVTKNVEDEKDLEKPEWRALVAWIWKLVPDEQARVERDGTWSSEWPRRGRSAGWDGGIENFTLANWLRTGAMGFDELAPDRPRPLPLGLVAALLGALLLVAGPVDWVLLGWLRRRRWTWVVFSLLCVLTAWIATQMAGRYIGRQGRTGLVRIVDIGPGERVLRETRIELSMPRDDVEWRTEIAEGLSVPLQAASEQVDPQFTVPNSYSSSYDQRSRTGQVKLSGQAGEWASEWGVGRYVHRQNLRQWTPAWRQSFAFPKEGEIAALDWAKFIANWRKESERPFGGEPNAQWQYAAFTASVLENAGPSPTYSPIRRAGRAEQYTAHVPWESRARQLFSADPGATGGLLANDSPSPADRDLVRVQLSHPLGIIAWRMVDHELHIYRRHVSQRELEGKK